MNLDIPSITRNLQHIDGIYYSPRHKHISYPEDGNAGCMQIEDDSFWFRHRNACITALVKRYSPNDIFFDIGGGNGYVSKGLQKEGIRTVLVEPGQQGARNAKKRGVDHVICATLEEAGLFPDTVNAAGLFDVVEHIEHDHDFLTMISRSMQKNGKLYITVPAYNFLWSNEDKDAGHYRRYTLQRMKKLLHNAGFDIIFSTYIFSFLPLPIFLTRTLTSKLGLNKNSNELEKHQEEHSEPSGMSGRILENIMKWEQKRIREGKTIPFGGSCLVVARKL